MNQFDRIYYDLAGALIDTPPVKVGKWHQMDVSNIKELETPELLQVNFSVPIPLSVPELQMMTRCNLPWAEDHFNERISAYPLNPPPSSAWWPFTMDNHTQHTDAKGKFSHTYPERMWPKFANRDPMGPANFGIRYQYGDLGHLLHLLREEPMTRQAYLPIWFPEDLSAVIIGERVPCTLGWHFILRPPVFLMTYMIRSCDLVRYFRDDFYMAARLLQWVFEKCYLNRPADEVEDTPWQDVTELRVSMQIISLHCMLGDIPKLTREVNANKP